MSYTFLFKYIIIGDSGIHSLLTKMSGNHVYCYNILTKNTDRNMKLRSEFSLVLN